MDIAQDTHGNKHYILGKMGVDGQGTLYATKNKNIILREAANAETNPDLIPLSEVDKLLLPIDYLAAPNVGYLINIPEDAVPLSHIMSNVEAMLPAKGIKRRLIILCEVAKILIKLHSLPVMYGSMSPLRIFLTPKTDEAYLLYSDKINFSMSFTAESDADPYISPEAKNGKGTTLASDSYTFGALAYDFLTLGQDEDALSDDLKEMLENTQLEKPLKRPKIAEIYKILLRQIDLIVTCKKCNSDFYYNKTECLGCSSPPPRMFKAKIYDKVGESDIPRGLKILEFASHGQFFWNYHTDNTLLTGGRLTPRIHCVLNISEDRKLNLIFKNLMDKKITINDQVVDVGKNALVSLPCELVRITFSLYDKTYRYIDMVMI